MEYNNIDNENFDESKYYGISTPDGAYAGSGFYLQKRPTSAGWVEGSEGFVQQTFLGASVVNFSISAGFNDTPNTLNVSLVADTYNKSDGLPIGSGDDVYHDGKSDCFAPPPIGAPVFFKFGNNFATVHQAYAKSYDMIYRFGLLPSGFPEFKKEDTNQEEVAPEVTPEVTPEGEAQEDNSQDTFPIRTRTEMEATYKTNSGFIDSETGEECDPEEDQQGDQQGEGEEQESTCVSADSEESRAILDYHFLKEGEHPSLGYDNATPPQPIPNTNFIDKTKLYDPASVGIDPEVLDKFSQPITTARGSGHIVFGGILDSFTESKNANGNPIYSVSVSDPKELLSNCTLILNDYAETTYNNKNLFNVYGFLEHEVSKELQDSIDQVSVRANYLTRFDQYNEEELEEHNKFVNLEDCYWMTERAEDPHLRSDFKKEVPKEEDQGAGTATGNIVAGDTTDEDEVELVPFVPKVGIRLGDKFGAKEPEVEGEVGEDGEVPVDDTEKTEEEIQKEEEEKRDVLKSSNVKYWYPITGFGMSRRSEKGMPLYRIIQSLPFLNYFMPQECRDNGFGGAIDFRGYKFALNVDGLNDLFLDESLIESVDVDPLTNKQCPAKTNADVLKDIYIDLDDITLLELIQEIASVFNKDFVVELLPPIDRQILESYPIKETDSIYEVFEISDYNEGIIGNIQGEVFKTVLDEDGKEKALEDEKDKYKENDLIVGIITVTFIDKNKQPTFDELQKFIEANEYENAEIGYDLINGVTDKFVVGAQKVDLYFFSSDRDRDLRLKVLNKLDPNKAKQQLEIFEGEQWTFREALKQQILPFYGELADGIASIPVGFGPFQQILLNSESLNALGVGDYYLATEIELRAAMVSFKAWVDFLLKYNRRYVEGFFVEDYSDTDLEKYAELPDEAKNQILDNINIDPNSELSEGLKESFNNFRCGVSVPRSVIVSNENWYQSAIKNSKEINEEDDISSPSDLPPEEDLYDLVVDEIKPARSCFPPYGYPLYFGRASAIGIFSPSDISRLSDGAEFMDDLFTEFPDEIKEILTNGINHNIFNKLDQRACEEQLLDYYKQQRSDEIKVTPEQGSQREKINDKYRQYKKVIIKLCENLKANPYSQLLINNYAASNGNFTGFVNKIIRVNENNAKKVHTFIRDIAEEHLGKSFLVKIPQKTNLRYSSEIITNDVSPENGMVIMSGAFGFPSIFESGKIIPTGLKTDEQEGATQDAAAATQDAAAANEDSLYETLEAITNYDFLYKDEKEGDLEALEFTMTYNPPFMFTDIDASGFYTGSSRKVDGRTYIELTYKSDQEEQQDNNPSNQDTGTEDQETPASNYTGLHSIFTYDPRFSFDLESLKKEAQAQTDGAGTDGAGTDGAGTDGAGTDGAGTDGAGTDGAGTDGAGTDEESQTGLAGVKDYKDILKSLEQQISYTEGAFKARYNPTIDDWDFNYIPQSQGGYYNFEIGVNRLRDDGLFPLDGEKLRSSDNRISPYAIYNNSQLLYFLGGDKKGIIQEKVEKDTSDVGVTNRRKRMDIVTVLDNVGSNEPQYDKPYKPNQGYKFNSDFDFYSAEHVAFVKCSVEEKLLFAPRFCVYKDIQISSTEFKYVPYKTQNISYVTEEGVRFQKDITDDTPKKIGVAPTGEEFIQAQLIQSVFAPSDPTGELPRTNVNSIEFVDTKYCDIYTETKNSFGKTLAKTTSSDEEKVKSKNLILTNKVAMNSEHVYAVVKLSSRPIQMHDTRYTDGPQSSTNPVTLAKIWNRDTIKNGGPNRDFKDPPALTLGVEKERIKLINKIQREIDPTFLSESLPLANPEIKIDFVHPSPVYPNIIALPLLSKERCYGPWTSTTTLTRNKDRGLECNETYADIGGKVEYVKDENLSPWKFGGYENLNKAGEIQVAFSNNLMLFTERATFTVPGIAKEVYIGRPLFNNSPIVDSVSLDVDSDSIRTTISLEIFSKKFGKTEKQRQEQLARLTREEKLRRQNKNRLIRSGSILPSENVTAINQTIQGLSIGQNASPHFSSLETKNTVYDSVVASVVPEKTNSIIYPASGTSPSNSGIIKRGETITSSNTVAFQKKGYLQEIQSNYTDINELNNSLQRSAGALLNDIYFPFDESVYNPYMSDVPHVDITSITKRTS